MKLGVRAIWKSLQKPLNLLFYSLYKVRPHHSSCLRWKPTLHSHLCISCCKRERNLSVRTFFVEKLTLLKSFSKGSCCSCAKEKPKLKTTQGRKEKAVFTLENIFKIMCTINKVTTRFTIIKVHYRLSLYTWYDKEKWEYMNPTGATSSTGRVSTFLSVLAIVSIYKR